MLETQLYRYGYEGFKRIPKYPDRDLKIQLLVNRGKILRKKIYWEFEMVEANQS
jgi:hypothetical protein